MICMATNRSKLTPQERAICIEALCVKIESEPGTAVTFHRYATQGNLAPALREAFELAYARCAVDTDVMRGLLSTAPMTASFRDIEQIGLTLERAAAH